MEERFKINALEALLFAAETRWKWKASLRFYR